MQDTAAIPQDALAALYFLPGQYLLKVFGEGIESVKPLSSEQVSKAFRDAQTDTGWLERRVLRYREKSDSNALLSYEPAGLRSILIERDNGMVETISLPLPTLILLGFGKSYHLWAAASGPINAATKLATAPLPNIGTGMQGGICFGKNEIPDCRPENLDSVWRLIFETPFNRDQANGKCRSEPDDVRKLLYRIAATRPRAFPKHELLSRKATIDDAWNSLIEKRNTYSY